MDKKKGLALTVSFAGLVLILGSSFTFVDPRGITLALGASLLYSLYIIVGDITLKDAPLAVATMWISLAAGVGIGVIGLVTGQMNFQFGPSGWLAVLGLAIFSTVMAILAFLQGVVLVGAARASIVSTLEPPVTVLLAFIFLAEVLGPLQLVGGVLVMASAILVNYVKPKNKKVSETVQIDGIM